MYARIAMTVFLLAVPMATPIDARADEPTDAAELSEATDGHRVLRDNEPAGFATPTEPESFAGYPDAPSFTVVDRSDKIAFYPCAACHGVLPLNPQPRKLMAPHPAAMDHGNGQFWCLDCHAADDRDQLRTLSGGQVAFNEAYLVCGQCHYEPQKDWYFGAHGKRAGGWQEERSIFNCTHCHNPHDPAIKPRAPEAPPPLRKGLEPMPPTAHPPASMSGAAEPEARE